jgi:hypothetical protein
MMNFQTRQLQFSHQVALIRLQGGELIEGGISYLIGDLGLLALGGFLQIDDLSLLYHAATSQEAGQQQSNFIYILLMVPFYFRKWSQRGEILRRLSIEMVDVEVVDFSSRKFAGFSVGVRLAWD